MAIFIFWGGAHPKKTKKNQSLHQNRQIGIGFFWFFFWFLKFPNWHWFFWFFFWFFLVFFGIGFGQNSKLETGFFLVFLVFFGFFWLKLWPTFEIGNWFLGFFGFFWFFWFFLGFFGIFGFFWHLILRLECHPQKNQKKQKIPKKNQKNQKKPKKNQSLHQNW